MWTKLDTNSCFLLTDLFCHGGSITMQSYLTSSETDFKYMYHTVYVYVGGVASWGTTAATRVTRLRIGERPREWTRG